MNRTIDAPFDGLIRRITGEKKEDHVGVLCFFSSEASKLVTEKGKILALSANCMFLPLVN